MGALGCVAGPLSHCPAPALCSPADPSFPFYTGPCPPCSQPCARSCGCNFPCASPCAARSARADECTAEANAIAMFTLDAPFAASDGGCLDLSAAAAAEGCFAECESGVRILRPGLYHVFWTINVPGHQSLSSRLYLSLNGSELAASGQHICAQADSTSTAAAGQAVFRAGAGDVLSLNAERGFQLNTACSLRNVITLTICKIR